MSFVNFKAIILLKGKRVDLLQSYHHTGAIWTMYAGFRSAAPPVWLFVIFNSAVHSIMYCYYALSAMKLPFPRFLKKQITRMQITQFLVGGTFFFFLFPRQLFLADLINQSNRITRCFVSFYPTSSIEQPRH